MRQPNPERLAARGLGVALGDVARKGDRPDEVR
jgi:hypothetical protein